MAWQMDIAECLVKFFTVHGKTSYREEKGVGFGANLTYIRNLAHF